MQWANQRKRKIVTMVIGVVILLVSFFVYQSFFTTEPTCFDKKQNQNERGVDCGGVCQLMCTADVRPLIPLWTRPFKITGDVYSVVSYIENQNMGNGIREVPYEIRLFDEKNILVTEPIRGTTFIGPNDKTAVFVSPIKTGNRVPKTAFLKFLKQPEFYTVDPIFNTQNLIIENEQLSDVDTAPKLTAQVRNVSTQSFQQIPVVAIIYDATGNAIAVSQTFIDVLDAGSTAPVNFSWPEPFSAVPARREIIPRINPFIQESV